MISMKNFIQRQVIEVRKLKFYVIIPFVIMILAYSIYFIDKGIFAKLNIEDGLFEYLTAILLLFTSVIFFKVFMRTRKIINLLFCFAFFFGFGEEISWGQRILNFNTPDYVLSQNRQEEFNLHNFEFTTAVDVNNNPKPVLKRYLNFGAFYLLFCLGYSILYPLLYERFNVVRKLGGLTGLLVPPLLFGLMFLVNYIISQIIIEILSVQHLRTDECFEFIMALIFSFLSLYFLINLKVDIGLGQVN